MKPIKLLGAFALLLTFGMAGILPARTEDNKDEKQGHPSVEVNKDGFNDNAANNEDQGIPNDQDPDYDKPGGGKGRGAGFVDQDGDGINDDAPDDDGDGIPDGQDPDYKGYGKGRGGRFHGFVDEDGDGINDRLVQMDSPDGSGPRWMRPEECLGKGFGRGARMGRGFGEDGSKTGGENDGMGNGPHRGGQGPK